MSAGGEGRVFGHLVAGVAGVEIWDVQHRHLVAGDHHAVLGGGAELGDVFEVLPLDGFAILKQHLLGTSFRDHA